MCEQKLKKNFIGEKRQMFKISDLSMLNVFGKLYKILVLIFVIMAVWTFIIDKPIAFVICCVCILVDTLMIIVISVDKKRIIQKPKGSNDVS